MGTAISGRAHLAFGIRLENDSAEVGYGAALGLICFGLRTDLRQIGEEGVAVNLQVETFIADSGGRIVTTLDDLVAALIEGAAALTA